FLLSNASSSTCICTLSLHDALPIFLQLRAHRGVAGCAADQARVAFVDAHPWKGGRIHLNRPAIALAAHENVRDHVFRGCSADLGDRKSTRLNSSHVKISYAVFCLTK